MPKKLTLREKVKMYENFLHKINMFCIAGEHGGIAELVRNADLWSYAHRRGNGELSDREQDNLINSKFWNLCDTPETDKATQERQKLWTENNKSKK